MATTKVSVTIEGADALIKAFARMPDDVKAASANAVQASTFAVAQRMRANALVNTGRLKRSISTTMRGLSGRVVIDDAAFYWRFPEYGTVKMIARPFIRPAAEAEASVYERRFSDIGKRLERDFASSRFV